MELVARKTGWEEVRYLRVKATPGVGVTKDGLGSGWFSSAG